MKIKTHIAILAIAAVMAIFPSHANAQVSTNFWKLITNQVRPVLDSWTIFGEKAIFTNATTTNATTTNMAVTGAFNVSGTATSTFAGNVKVSGNLEVTGVSLFSIVSSGNMNVNGTLTTTGNLTLSGTNANIVLGSNWLSGDGGDEGVFVGPTGNVGIGTTGPVALLSVDFNSMAIVDAPASSGVTPNNAMGRFSNNRGIALDIGGQYNSPNGIWLQVASKTNLGDVTYPLLLNPNGGKVGIGTTNPATKLDSNGTIRVFGSTSGATSGAGLELQYGASGANIYSYDRTNSLYKDFNLNDFVMIKSTGNVGIGTTAPGTKLQVSSGNSAYLPSLATFSIQKVAEGYGLFAGISTSGASWFQSGTSDDITKYDMVFQPNGGNVGIGTTTPSSKLAVSGGASIGANYNFAAPTNGLIVEGNVGIGITAPLAPLHVTVPGANATSTVEIGKTGQNKGSCLVLYDVTGTVQYITVQGGALVVSATSCK